MRWSIWAEIIPAEPGSGGLDAYLDAERPQVCQPTRAHYPKPPPRKSRRRTISRALLFRPTRDLLQVKYEMLRRVRIEGQQVGLTAATFGFSRMSLYQLRKRFEAAGLAGLLPQRKGPRRAHKLSEDVLDFVLETLKTESELRTVELPQRVAKQFGISVHLRSIERALARRQKKDWPPMLDQTGPSQLSFGAGSSVRGNMKSCVARPWRLGRYPIAMVWNWPSSKAGAWRPGWRMCRPAHRPLRPRLICNRSRPKPRAAILSWRWRHWS